MSSLEEIRDIRLQKRAALASAYPATLSGKRTKIADAKTSFAERSSKKTTTLLAGRLRALRSHGGSVFADMEDGTGRMQAYVKKDAIGEDAFRRFNELVDLGDFIECAGTLFLTKKKEQTLEAHTWRMLAKSIRPLPEKWHGLTDVEERFRRRYLDLLASTDARKRFVLRTKILGALRAFFDREEFLEVETPMLHPIAGGALAEPFLTHHNALNIDLFLRVAPELYLKRLLVGGFERVYELGKSFRNEGIDAEHNPEFTSAEWYAAYWDEEDMMACVERCVAFLFKTLGTAPVLELESGPITIPQQFKRMTFTDLLKRYARISDYAAQTRDSLALCAAQFGISVASGAGKGKIADEIYKKICRPRLVEPVFVVGHPTEISPLAKADAGDPRTARRFQLVIGAMEVVNGFAELNDPEEQRERFREQTQLRRAGDTESHEPDEAFVEALEYGMPPAAGAGLGVDRLVMLLAGSRNIREVILFPTMRQK